MIRENELEFQLACASWTVAIVSNKFACYTVAKTVHEWVNTRALTSYVCRRRYKRYCTSNKVHR